jgi:hypothetical protein
MNSKLVIMAAAGALAFPAAGCASHPQAAVSTRPLPASVTPSPSPTANSDVSAKARQVKPTRRVAALGAAVPAGVPMPNQALTPGAIQSSDTAAICTPGWAEAHRDVSYPTEDYVAQLRRV